MKITLFIISVPISFDEIAEKTEKIKIEKKHFDSKLKSDRTLLKDYVDCGDDIRDDDIFVLAAYKYCHEEEVEEYWKAIILNELQFNLLKSQD